MKKKEFKIGDVYVKVTDEIIDGLYDLLFDLSYKTFDGKEFLLKADDYIYFEKHDYNWYLEISKEKPKYRVLLLNPHDLILILRNKHLEEFNYLKQEAKKRGLFDGAIISEIKRDRHFKLSGFFYNYQYHELSINSVTLFSKGVWCDVVKESTIPKIGDKCEFWDINYKESVKGILQDIDIDKRTYFINELDGKYYYNAIKI